MVKIRLMRLGAKKRPYFRVVVADSRSPRDGRFIEKIGKYHPMEHPSLIEIDEGRALHWLGRGAQPSDPVRNLLVKTGIWDKFQGGPGTPVPPPPGAHAPSAEAEAAEEPPAEPEGESPEAAEEVAETAEAAAGEEKLPAGEAEQPGEEPVAEAEDAEEEPAAEAGETEEEKK